MMIQPLRSSAITASPMLFKIAFALFRSSFMLTIFCFNLFAKTLILLANLDISSLPSIFISISNMPFAILTAADIISSIGFINRAKVKYAVIAVATAINTITAPIYL